MRRLFTVQTSTSQALKQGLKYKYHSEFWSKNNTKIFLHWHNPLLGPIPKSFPYFRESINSSSFHHKSTSPCGSLSCLFPHSFFSCHFFLGGEVVIDMQDYNYDPTTTHRQKHPPPSRHRAKWRWNRSFVWTEAWAGKSDTDTRISRIYWHHFSLFTLMVPWMVHYGAFQLLSGGVRPCVCVCVTVC